MGDLYRDATCLLLSNKPNDAYFTLHSYEERTEEESYSRDMDGFAHKFLPKRRYEYFNADAWAWDTFHQDYKTVLAKHVAVAEECGAVRTEYPQTHNVEWDFEHLNISDAEEKIEEYRLDCKRAFKELPPGRRPRWIDGGLCQSCL